MKLNWLRAGCASIAECGNRTLVAQRWDGGEYGWHVVGRGSTEFERSFLELREAEAACEAWLDKHDKPVWHDVTEWLSWAEWRGFHLYCRLSTGGVNWEWYRSNGRGAGWSLASSTEAKAAAEKYVREQTGGGK